MKKAITAIALLVAVYTNAQIKEGAVIYTTTIEGLPPEQAAMMGSMETQTFFKGNKSYTEMHSMMYDMKIVSDENGSLTLMDQGAMKKYIKVSKADMEKKNTEAKNKTKIEYINETKTIAGYECKKAIISYAMQKDKENIDVKTEVWYTDQLSYVSAGGGSESDMFNGLKGMVMEYSINQGTMKMRITAKKISLDPVPDSKFLLSLEGYTEMKIGAY